MQLKWIFLHSGYRFDKRKENQYFATTKRIPTNSNCGGGLFKSSLHSQETNISSLDQQIHYIEYRWICLSLRRSSKSQLPLPRLQTPADQRFQDFQE
ncbi:hypothetical protein FGO68_gene7674 [Halteria grandinella]|uniref:Uncharacterized protein n=1 Tax=Halteria grandinella TaxID=5974 RepID=A0A8J8P0W0_HALGN|nr:hypothetical protein FGO68_gene7674 [Halteria grandinella]